MADSRTILLFKKGDHLDLKNYRPISLLPTIYKVLSRVISARIDRTLDEVSHPDRKKPRTRSVTTEMLKLAKSRILPQLTAILNQCLRSGEIPAEMADSRTILLFKKGDHLDLKNYRPISLLPTIYKVLSRVISARIDRTLDEAQPIEQAGFRKNCSTAEHLQAVNQLLEKAREYRVPIFMVFIDFEKAFDSVESNAIWNAAQRQGVHPKLLKLLRNIYSQATSKIQVGRAQVQIEIQRGVRQGDTISPKLFNAALEETFKELRWEDRGLNINGRRISNLRFADDIVLIADTEEELQLMVTELQEASRRSGLKINRQKTKAMAAEEINILLDGEAIEQRSVQGNRSPDQQRMERLQEVWPVPDLQKRPDAMEAAALQPMHPAGAAVRMRILGLDSSSKKEARSRPTTNGEKDGRGQAHRPSQQRLAPPSRRSRTSPKQRQEENGPSPGRWPTPAPTSGPHALKHGGRRQHDPRKTRNAMDR
ncbi:hypothetical protein L596_030900 [Steinernema carpocapsae]|uniref:Reverse transcriptase domain-containing protein n=1 Tax=Steinernema carpocapsae TaxID=34508 RepID=A0A4U5MHA5_STECR|nr:hypothetical protein L596_030900 [Steinernema carpocapsae]